MRREREAQVNLYLYTFHLKLVVPRMTERKCRQGCGVNPVSIYTRRIVWVQFKDVLQSKPTHIYILNLKPTISLMNVLYLVDSQASHIYN